jgi:hypothetical protein
MRTASRQKETSALKNTHSLSIHAMINLLEIIFFELVVREYQLAAAFYSENRQLKWFGRSYDREI